MSKYNQVCSFNGGLAMEIGIEPAIVYHELAFWSDKGSRADGYIYKTLDELAERLPIKPRTIRRAIDKLVATGYIDKRIMKIKQTPTMHFKILKEFGIVQSGQIELSKVDKSIETTHLDKSIYTVINTSTNIQDPRAGELLNLLNFITKRSFRTLPRGTGRLLKTFTVNEIGTALENLANDPWHKERLGQLSSDYLLRATTIDKWLTAEVKKPAYL